MSGDMERLRFRVYLGVFDHCTAIKRMKPQMVLKCAKTTVDSCLGRQKPRMQPLNPGPLNPKRSA